MFKVKITQGGNTVLLPDEFLTQREALVFAAQYVAINADSSYDIIPI